MADEQKIPSTDTVDARLSAGEVDPASDSLPNEVGQPQAVPAETGLRPMSLRRFGIFYLTMISTSMITTGMISTLIWGA
ncbi:MAG: hypothetical protein M3454_02390 [Actinomycetota bacterium]|nr:hypothetical protein [Actinomycetota bacterium]